MLDWMKQFKMQLKDFQDPKDRIAVVRVYSEKDSLFAERLEISLAFFSLEIHMPN